MTTAMIPIPSRLNLFRAGAAHAGTAWGILQPTITGAGVDAEYLLLLNND
jgi:hypothetical protein